MNWRQFGALIRIRYQLSYNQIKKAGKLNLVLSIIAIACAMACSVSAFFIGTFGGAIWFRDASSTTILVTWNVVIALFLAMWLIGLLAELQQTELMSMDKLLHLPVSLKGAFFLNYASSFVNTTFVMFMPLMIGLSLGLVFARGIGLILAFPLMFGFLFAVTTLTYQLRGWLARVMENKRTRGTIIAGATILIIMLSQIPNLINLGFQGSRKDKRRAEAARLESIKEIGFLEIDARIMAGEIQPRANGYFARQVEISAKDELVEHKRSEKSQRIANVMEAVEKIDAWAPPGWLALGVVRADQGDWLPGLLGSFGLFSIGLVSLSLSYRASLRKYTGVEAQRKRRRKRVAVDSRRDEFLHKKLPLVTEQCSAIALTSFRCLLRAPESKMALIFPMIIGMLSISFLLGKRDFAIPEMMRPWIPIGIVGITMFGISSMLFNQFGIDRDGFRALVLSPVRRKDILLGKNLAVAPLAWGFCLALLGIMQFIVPQRIFSLAASIEQMICVYLLYCCLGNTVSIFFPMGIKRGSMQPANPRFVPMLIMLAGFVVCPIILMLPTAVALAIPTAIEAATEYPMGWLFLLLSTIQLGLTGLLYWWCLQHQQNWLWKREPGILDVVANIPE